MCLVITIAIYGRLLVESNNQHALRGLLCSHHSQGRGTCILTELSKLLNHLQHILYTKGIVQDTPQSKIMNGLCA